MRLRSTLRATAAAALTALLIGACSGAPQGGNGNGNQAPQVSPLEALSLASAKTTEAKTAKFALSISSDVPSAPGAGDLAVQGEGAIDFSTNTMRMNMDAAGEQIEMLFDGKAYYMKIPSLSADPSAAQVFGNKPWIKMDLETLSEASGTDMTGLSQNTGQDPTQALRYLQGASDDIREVGKEQVRGVDTTRYTATLDLNKALEEQAPEYKEQMQKNLDLFTSTTMPADVWIDGEGRLSKMEYTMEVKRGPAAPSGGNVKTTMEMFEYGTAVDVTVPSAEQVTDFAEVLQQLQGLTG